MFKITNKEMENVFKKLDWIELDFRIEKQMLFAIYWKCFDVVWR